MTNSFVELKVKVQQLVDEIVIMDNREKKIRDLHITIVNDYEILEIITKEQHNELLKVLDDAIRKYDLSLVKLI